MYVKFKIHSIFLVYFINLSILFVLTPYKDSSKIIEELGLGTVL